MSAAWMEALESQLDALHMVKAFLKSAAPEVRDIKSWNVDRALLEVASPFAWSAEVIDAVIAAGATIPLDTPLNKWNLECETAWWHFEKPLPFQTVADASMGIRAICFGWLKAEDRTLGLPVCCWLDKETDYKFPSRVLPSQTFEWRQGETLGGMLEQTRKFHEQRYGKEGPDYDKPQVGVEVFMAATEGCARFVLAGLAWLGQKVLVTADGHIERHRRKDFEKQTRREARIRVVQLRRNEYHHDSSKSDFENAKDYWTCRWVVGGHWRNQACGPKHGDRKLTWIPPYVKGPDDKPMKASTPKAYEVSR